MKTLGFIPAVDLDNEWMTYTTARVASHILSVKYRSLGFEASIVEGPYISMTIALPPR